MPPDFDRPHLDISDRVASAGYTSHLQNRGGGSAPRIREEHGAMLREQLRASFQEELEQRVATAMPEETEPLQGAYYEVELLRGAKAEKLERKRDHITVGATKSDPQSERISTVVFIPDESVPVLEQILSGRLTRRSFCRRACRTTSPKTTCRGLSSRW